MGQSGEPRSHSNIGWSKLKLKDEGMKVEEHLKALKKFNEKAEKLLNSLFAEFTLQRKRLSVRIDAKKGEEVIITKNLPDHHVIDEFVLTFRFFIQDNETSSFRNIAKTYSDIPASAELKKEFSNLRKELNEYLDADTTIKINKETLKRRKILDTFIFGNLAHENPSKKQIFDQWMRYPSPIPELLELEFDSILANVLRIIQYAKILNTRTISEILH